MADVKVGTLHVDIAGDTTDLQKSLSQAEKELKGFDENVSQSVQSLGEMKREFRTLSRMSLVGKSPEEIDAMNKRMAFLKDEIGDTNATIKSLSLDPFQKLAETVQVGSTVMAGLAGATSMLGGEQEKMQELMQKTVALIAIANAAQEVATFTQERAAGIWLKNKTLEIAARLKEILTINTSTVASTAENAVKSKGNIITQAITKAQWLWNAAVAANPIGIIIAGVIALAAGIGVLIAKMSKNTQQFEDAANAVKSLNRQIENNLSFNKLVNEAESILGKSQAQRNETRKKQIDEEVELTNKLIEKNRVLAKETGFFGGETKQAKEASATLDELYKKLVELSDEKTLLGLQNTVEENKRAEEVKDINDKLIASMLTGKQREIAELNIQYAKDLKAWSDSKETQKLLTQKYNKDIAAINATYRNLEQRAQEQAFLDMAKPLSKSIPAANIQFPVKLEPIVDVQPITDSITLVMVDLQTEIQNGLANLAVDFSDVIGQIAVGSAGMSDIFDIMLGTIADFMRSLGQSLIASGVAAIAFNDLLISPEAAIIAGGVLVGLSAAIKSKLASGPTGSGATYSSGASYSGGSSSSTAYGSRMLGETMQVEVTGVIKASGRELQVVLDNESKRRSL